MEKDLEKQPFLQTKKDVRLVEGNKFRIKRHHISKWLFTRDLYHTLLGLNGFLIFLVLITMYDTFNSCMTHFHRYFVIAVTYAALYYAIVYPDPRATDLQSFGQAMIASLQIQSTIGFASPSAEHWSRNWKVVLVITLHSITTVIFNIFLLGTLFARLSSAKNRAITVRLSTRAIISQQDQYPVLSFRVGEIRRHQLLNLNISVYLFHHESSSNLFVREKLLTSPSTGIFLAVPAEIQHVIDESSPLWKLVSPQFLEGGFACKVCGDEFASKQQLEKHLNFYKNAQHLRFKADVVALPRPSLTKLRQSLSERSSKQEVVDSYFELIVLVEGTEPVTGSPIQVRHSYTFSDIVFGGSFMPCWRVETDVGGSRKKIVVNFDTFNKIIYPN